MQCFTHQDRHAIGICRVCGKGLCTDCAADLGHSLACKNRHEAQAEQTFALVQRSIRVQGMAGKTGYVVPVLFGFMGTLFAAISAADNSWAAPYFLMMGLAFVAFAVIVLILNRRAYAATTRDVAK